MESIVIEKVWITDSAVWVRTVEGKEACEKFSDFPRLKYATQKERLNFTLSKDGIHWNDIDEDLSFEGFFVNKKTNTLYNLFIAHPELNASAIARRLGISQSLFGRKRFWNRSVLLEGNWPLCTSHKHCCDTKLLKFITNI